MRSTMFAYVMSFVALLQPHRQAVAAMPCPAVAETTLKLSFDNPALLPSVKGTINGKPATLLLDTGSDLTLLTTRMPLPAARFSLGTSIGGFEGNTRLRKVKIDSLKVGPIVLLDTTLPAEQAESRLSTHWDGILGADLLLRYDLDISFDTSSVTIYPAGSCAPAWTEQAHAIPLIKQGKSLIPRMTATLGTQSALAIADTGATNSLVLRQFISAGMPDTRIAATGKRVSGFGGESGSIGSAQIGTLALGGTNFPAATWHIVEQNKGGGTDSVLLGGDFFGAHRVFISSASATLYYRASASKVSSPFKPNTSWYQALARQGNLTAQLKLVELASSLAERLEWQAMAAAQGHTGSLVTLAVHARNTGRLPEATEYISRALQRDPRFHQALVERYLVTQARSSREVAIRELTGTIEAEHIDTLTWPGTTYNMLLQRTTVAEFVDGILQEQRGTLQQRCSAASLLRQLRKAGQGWENIVTADLTRLCPGRNGDGI